MPASSANVCILSWNWVTASVVSGAGVVPLAPESSPTSALASVVVVVSSDDESLSSPQAAASSAKPVTKAATFRYRLLRIVPFASPCPATWDDVNGETTARSGFGAVNDDGVTRAD